MDGNNAIMSEWVQKIYNNDIPEPHTHDVASYHSSHTLELAAAV